MPDSSEDDSDSLSSSDSDSDGSSVSSGKASKSTGIVIFCIKYSNALAEDEPSQHSRTPTQYQPPRSLHPNHWTGYSAYGSGTSTPVSGADLKPPTSKRSTGKKPVTKRAPVTTKTRRIQQVPMDAEGNPILPVQIGIITLHSLGQIITDRDNFHNERYIYPVGYTSSRYISHLQLSEPKCKLNIQNLDSPYQSIVHPDKQTSYKCSVSDGGDGPRFHVEPEDAPDKAVVAQSATGAWTAIIKGIGYIWPQKSCSVRPHLCLPPAANAIRKREHSNSASGPDYFGFSHPTISACIQALPGAKDCKHYVWQNVCNHLLCIMCLIRIRTNAETVRSDQRSWHKTREPKS